jgi:H+/Cl- antiporter ClcA
MSANPNASPTVGPDANLPWYRGLTKYHGFILMVCWMAWFFDTMDQQLFVLARAPAILSSLGSIDSPFRYAAFTVAGVFVVGLLVLLFAPETKGKPLPE